MKAKVFLEFRTLRPGDKKNSVVEAGEVVEGALASAAIANGFGKQVSDETPVGLPGKPVAAPASAKAADKKAGKGKAEKAGASGDDGGGDGGDGGEA